MKNIKIFLLIGWLLLIVGLIGDILGNLNPEVLYSAHI